MSLMRFLTVRIVVGVVEGVVLMSLASQLGWKWFNTCALLAAAFLSIAISAGSELKHLASWRERGDTAGAASFILMTGLAGAPVVAVAAYVAFFAAGAAFMAP
jgi:hypothetical protein